MKSVSILIVASLALGLAACQPPAPSAASTAPNASAPERGRHLNPPALATVEAKGGELRLEGTAAPGARVRLATPAGEARFAQADPQGRWTLALPAASRPRIFGLSMSAGERVIQAEGYVLLLADGGAVLLRSGAGALRIGAPVEPQITAVDFDGDGGAVVSGHATPGGLLSVTVDGRPFAEGRADEDGRFDIALTQPLTPGPHQIVVTGEGMHETMRLDADVARPPADGPFRARAIPGGLRVDWLTPGGGLQSTVIAR